MFRQLNSYLIPTIVLLIFKCTSVSMTTCSAWQITCTSYIAPYDTWCCENYQICMYSTETCYGQTTTESSYPDPISPVIYVIVVISFVFCSLFITCCVRAQRIRQQQQIRARTFYGTPQVAVYPYQQTPVRGAARVVQVRPIYNVSAAPSPPVHNMYEAPPPSYEAATRNVQPKQAPSPTAPPPPSDATLIQQRNLRV